MKKTKKKKTKNKTNKKKKKLRFWLKYESLFLRLVFAGTILLPAFSVASMFQEQNGIFLLVTFHVVFHPRSLNSWAKLFETRLT